MIALRLGERPARQRREWRPAHIALNQGDHGDLLLAPDMPLSFTTTSSSRQTLPSVTGNVAVTAASQCEVRDGVGRWDLQLFEEEGKIPKHNCK